MNKIIFSISLTGFFHLRVPESSAVGSAVGRIKAHDLDIGRNAEVQYTIVPGDGGAMFDITTNEHNQEGIIILKRVCKHILKNKLYYTKYLVNSDTKQWLLKILYFILKGLELRLLEMI